MKMNKFTPKISTFYQFTPNISTLLQRSRADLLQKYLHFLASGYIVILIISLKFIKMP